MSTPKNKNQFLSVLVIVFNTIKSVFMNLRQTWVTRSIQPMTWSEHYSKSDITGAGELLRWTNPRQQKKSLDEMFVLIKGLLSQLQRKSGIDAAAFDKLAALNRKNNRLHNWLFFTIADTLRKIQHVGSIYEWDIKGMPHITSFDKCIELIISPALLVCRATVYRILQMIDNFYVLRRRFTIEPDAFGFDLYLIRDLYRARNLAHKLQQSQMFYERINLIQEPDTAIALIQDIKELKKLDDGDRTKRKTDKSKLQTEEQQIRQVELPDTVYNAGIMSGLKQNLYVTVISVLSEEDREIKLQAFESVKKQYLDEMLEPDISKIRSDILEWIDIPFYENKPYNNPIFNFQAAFVYLKGCSAGMSRTTLLKAVICFILGQKINDHIWKDAGYGSAADFCKSKMEIKSNLHHLRKIGRNLFRYFDDIQNHYRAESIGAAYNLQYLDKVEKRVGDVQTALEMMVSMPHTKFRAFAQGKENDVSQEELDKQLLQVKKLIRLAQRNESKTGYPPLILNFLNKDDDVDFNFYVEQSYKQLKSSTLVAEKPA